MNARPERERSMAVRHYRAVYGTPPPLTWRQVARGIVTIALVGTTLALIARGLFLIAIGVLR